MAIDLDTVLKLPKPKKVLILAGIITVFIFLFISLLYLPKYKNLTSLNDRLTNLRSELAMEKKVAVDLPKYKKKTKELEEKVTLALKELPNQKEIPLLLKNISQLAQESGLQIILFQPQKEVSMDFYEEIPVKVKLTGGYHDIASFFDKVGSLSRIVNIKDLTIGEATLEGDKIRLTATCTAVTFRFVEKAPETEQPKKSTKVSKKAMKGTTGK